MSDKKHFQKQNLDSSDYKSLKTSAKMSKIIMRILFIGGSLYAISQTDKGKEFVSRLRKDENNGDFS